MRALVVFESMFGNTQQVADTVALGLRDRGAEVSVVRVGAPGDHQLAGQDLLVLGGPTHALAMSRPATRADASSRGAAGRMSRTGVREWLDSVGPDSGPTARPVAAVFDTRARAARHWPGSAARGMARALRRTGFEVPDRTSFYVAEVVGPVLAGELDRARAWGQHLASAHAGREAERQPDDFDDFDDLDEGAPSW